MSLKVIISVWKVLSSSDNSIREISNFHKWSYFSWSWMQFLSSNEQRIETDNSATLGFNSLVLNGACFFTCRMNQLEQERLDRELALRLAAEDQTQVEEEVSQSNLTRYAQDRVKHITAHSHRAKSTQSQLTRYAQNESQTYHSTVTLGQIHKVKAH